MASKEAPKKEGEGEEVAAPPKKSKKLMIIIIGVVVVTLGLGAGIGYMLGHKKAPAAAEGETASAEEKPKDEAKDEKKDEHKKPPVFVPLEPFTVNLQPEEKGGSDQFLQIAISLRVSDDKKGEEMKAYMPQIRHEILSLAGRLKASEVTSPDGREALADDIRDICNEVLGYDKSKKGKSEKSEKSKEKEGEHGETSDGPPVISAFFTQFIVQ